MFGSLIAKFFARAKEPTDVAGKSKGPVIYKLEDVFTSKEASATFVPREDHIWFESYMREHARPICIEGPLQAGKSTLVKRVCETVFPNGMISVVCNPDSTVDSIIRTAFQLLQPYYDTEVVRETQKLPHTLTDGVVDHVMHADADPSVTKVARLPIELISPVLAIFAAKADRPLIIDNAHKIAESEKKKLAYLAREWQAQITPHGYPKLVIIASDSPTGSMKHSLIAGAPDLADRLVNYPLKRMSSDELRKIIRRGGELLNVDFSKIEDYILELSGGQTKSRPGRPAYTHDLCKHACIVAGVKKTEPTLRQISPEEFETGLKVWFKTCAFNIKTKFDTFFEKPPSGATTSFCIQVCSLLAQSGSNGVTFSELSKHLSEEFSIPRKASDEALRSMTDVDPEDGIIELDQTTEHVRFSEPLYLAYYSKGKDVDLDIFASQDLAKYLASVFSDS